MSKLIEIGYFHWYIFMGKILTITRGGGVSPILTLTNEAEVEGSEEAKIMLTLLMDSPLFLTFSIETSTKGDFYEYFWALSK